MSKCTSALTPQKESMMHKIRLAHFLVVLFVVAIAWRVGMGVVQAQPRRDNAQILMRAQYEIEQAYVEDVDTDQLLHGALRGMVGSLDKHSQYLAPVDYQTMMAATEGEFGGLGIEITLSEQGILKVVTPLLGTPAYEAGVMAGDLILEIEGESTAEMTLNDAVKRLRGRPGTSVEIVILHKNSKEPKKVSVQRERIHIDSVRFPQMLDPERGVGYISVISFQSDTKLKLLAAIQKLRNQGMKALVLDLRNNPGGLLSQAIEVSDLFLTNGKIVTTRGGQGARRFLGGKAEITERARTAGTLPDFPIVVMINEGSASASEIVSAALRDNDRAVLVGAKSYGKGSVQSLIELPLGEEEVAALKLTTARYYTPSGISIHEQGIKPDLKVDMEPEAIRKWLEYQQKRWIRRNAGDNGEQQTSDLEKAEDPQLDVALRYLRARVARGPEAGKAFILAHQDQVREKEKEAAVAEADTEDSAPETEPETAEQE
jgi:carboxyl-terminal processing protease